MPEENQVIETTSIEESVSQFFEDESNNEESSKVEEKQEELQEEEINEDDSEAEEVEEDSEESEDEDEESDEEIEEGEVEDDWDKKLSGFVPEYKDLVKSINDPELRDKLLDAGKKQRAAIDRKISEIGEQKKQNNEAIENYKKMDLMLKTDPGTLIKHLAESANLKLNDLVETAHSESDYDEDDYRTPEEIKQDQELKDIKKELEALKNARVQEEQISAQQEVENFKNAVDDNGDPKYPFFDRVRANMGLLISQEGMTLEKAYEKAVLLDDELVAERDKEILRKAAQKRKYKIEKAKRLKKQSMKSKNLDSVATDPKALMEQAYDSVFS